MSDNMFNPAIEPNTSEPNTSEPAAADVLKPSKPNGKVRPNKAMTPAELAAIIAKSGLTAKQLGEVGKVVRVTTSKAREIERKTRGPRGERGSLVPLARLVIRDPAAAASDERLLKAVAKAKIVKQTPTDGTAPLPPEPGTVFAVRNDMRRYIPIFLEAKFGLREMEAWVKAHNAAPRK